MYPSSFRIWAIAARTLVEGIDTSDFLAIPPFRILVSISLIGSFTGIRYFSINSARTGSTTSSISSRPAIYLARRALGNRFGTLQTYACRLGCGHRSGSGSPAALQISAPCSPWQSTISWPLNSPGLARHPLAACKRHADQLEQSPPFVIGSSGGNKRHFHSAGLVDLVVFDLR